MGQQQLLLLILGTIIVGIAISVGVAMFRDNSISSNREALTTDLMHLAAKAQQYYYRPSTMGGGGQSFVGLTADAGGISKLSSLQFADNDNGTYSITTAGDANHVVIRAIGKVQLDDNTFPTLSLDVTQQSSTLTVIN